MIDVFVEDLESVILLPADLKLYMTISIRRIGLREALLSLVRVPLPNWRDRIL